MSLYINPSDNTMTFHTTGTSQQAHSNNYTLGDLQEIFEDAVDRIASYDQAILPEPTSVRPAALAMLLITYISEIQNMLTLVENFALYRYQGLDGAKLQQVYDMFMEQLSHMKTRFDSYWSEVFANLHFRCFQQPDPDGKQWFLFASFCHRPLPNEPTLPVLWMQKAMRDYDADIERRLMAGLTRVFAALNRDVLRERFGIEVLKRLVRFESDLESELGWKLGFLPSSPPREMEQRAEQERMTQRSDALEETEDQPNDADSEPPMMAEGSASAKDEVAEGWGSEDGEYEIDEEWVEQQQRIQHEKALSHQLYRSRKQQYAPSEAAHEADDKADHGFYFNDNVGKRKRPWELGEENENKKENCTRITFKWL